MGYLRKLNRKINEMQAEGKLSRPGLSHVTVIHEDDCPRLKGGECNCDPTVEEGPPPQYREQAKGWPYN